MKFLGMQMDAASLSHPNHYNLVITTNNLT